MAGILDAVNQRTQLVGQNRLELLLFRLKGEQIYGINVFKVKEVLQCPKLNLIPMRASLITGVAHIRGVTIPVIDLNKATGNGETFDIDDCFVIITEYNRSVQGFLVNSVERIVNMNWEEIHPPPQGTGKEAYLTAVTEVDSALVEILDVEKLLDQIAPRDVDIPQESIERSKQSCATKEILVVDDSSVARKQIQRCLEQIGMIVTCKPDGKKALEYIRELDANGEDVAKKFLMIISDIEMPEMDGYTLTTTLKSDPTFKNMHIVLHTSLSGIFNKAMVEKVGADGFLAKFNPEELAFLVTDRMNDVNPVTTQEAS